MIVITAQKLLLDDTEKVKKKKFQFKYNFVPE